MTTLEGINLMLTEMRLAPVLALDTGQTSDAGEAESILDRERIRILERGWAQNTDPAVEVYPPTDSIAFTVGTGPGAAYSFLVGESVGESVSGAKGIVQAVVGSTIFLANRGTVAFTGGQTLTGSASGATRAGSARPALTDGFLRVGTDWITVRQSSDEPLRITPRGGRLFNDADRTFVFTGLVKLTLAQTISFDQLSNKLARYIAIEAAMAFQRYKKGSISNEATITDNRDKARMEAEDEDSDLRRFNSHETAEARAMRGNRSRRAGYSNLEEERGY